jgi:tubulin polyglutamylase TTLL6/13
LIPEEFRFFPPTWILPQDAKDFRAQFPSGGGGKKKGGGGRTFIVKPEASCQGKGIFLTRNCDWMTNMNEHYVA